MDNLKNCLQEIFPVTGVFRTPAWLHEEMDTKGIWSSYEGARREILKEKISEMREKFPSSSEAWIMAAAQEETDKETEYYDEDSAEYLLGYLPFSEVLKYYPEDQEAQYSAICSYGSFGPIVQVTRSAWGINCRKCSPCFPFQGDGDSPGNDFIAFSLPAGEFSAEDGDSMDISRIFPIVEQRIGNLVKYFTDLENLLPKEVI